MALNSPGEPFSVPDPLGDAYDAAMAQNRALQAVNDPLGIGDTDAEPGPLGGAATSDDSGVQGLAASATQQIVQLLHPQAASAGAVAPSSGSGETSDPVADAKCAAARDFGAHYILDLIPQGEGTSSYDAVFNDATGSGKNYPAGWEKPTQLTVDQAIAMGPDLRRAANGDAVGMYQFTPRTLGQLKTWMHLDGSELLTPSMQDRMARELIHQRGYDGLTSTGWKDDPYQPRQAADEFQRELALEWPSLQGAPSASQFDGVRVRQPSISADVVRAAIAQAAKEADAISNGYIDAGRAPPPIGQWREPRRNGARTAH